MRVVKKPEERRAEMVTAAARLFAQQGFVRTSVAEIVSAVDVAKGLFYYYFTTKDDMVKAVVEGYCSYLGAYADSIADGSGTAAEKLDRLLQPEVWTQCFTAPLLSDLCLPQHAALYADLCDRVYAHMGPALRRIARQALGEAKAAGTAQNAGERDADRLVGMTLYGVLQMARRGEMTLDDARDIARRTAEALR